jgi:hypothetical protein
VKAGSDLGPFMELYFENLKMLEQAINPIME